MTRPTQLYGVVKPILTEEQVRQIKRIFKRADKEKRQRGHQKIRYGVVPRLAEEYGVSCRAIRHIRENGRWKWVKI